MTVHAQRCISASLVFQEPCHKQSLVDKKCCAFTLVELLVVIAILGLLAGLAIPAINRAQDSASRGVSVANLKNVGVAIQSCAADNNGRLPGPCFQPVSTLYQPNQGNYLGYQLYTYLMNEPRPENQTKELKPLIYPAYLKKRKATNAPSYALCYRFMTNGEEVTPFGIPNSTNNVEWTMARVAEYPGLFAMQEIDRSNAVTGRPDSIAQNPDWSSRLPDKPVHGSTRSTLYFDGSVRQVPIGQRP